MVICVERGADCSHMVQLMPLPSAKPHNLLPHLNPDWFYLSGTGLPKLSWKRGLSTGVVAVTLDSDRITRPMSVAVAQQTFLSYVLRSSLFCDRAYISQYPTETSHTIRPSVAIGSHSRTPSEFDPSVSSHSRKSDCVHTFMLCVH